MTLYWPISPIRIGLSFKSCKGKIEVALPPPPRIHVMRRNRKRSDLRGLKSTLIDIYRLAQYEWVFPEKAVAHASEPRCVPTYASYAGCIEATAAKKPAAHSPNPGSHQTRRNKAKGLTLDLGSVTRQCDLEGSLVRHELQGNTCNPQPLIQEEFHRSL